MVICPTHKSRNSGSLIAEVLVAISILSIGALPLMASFVAAQKSVRRSYQHAVAMELIDGEMEILLRGEWHQYHQGPQSYPLSGDATKNLPPGHGELTITGNHVRLEWLPDRPGEKVIREADAK